VCEAESEVEPPLAPPTPAHSRYGFGCSVASTARLNRPPSTALVLSSSIPSRSRSSLPPHLSPVTSTSITARMSARDSGGRAASPTNSIGSARSSTRVRSLFSSSPLPRAAEFSESGSQLRPPSLSSYSSTETSEVLTRALNGTGWSSFDLEPRIHDHPSPRRDETASRRSGEMVKR
jgi:hypothetical protein